MLTIIIDGDRYELLATEDADGDGRLDTATVVVNGARYSLTDRDGDGLPELIRVVRADDTHALLVRNRDSGEFVTLSDSAAPDGSIEEDASHWFTQSTSYTCGPAVITMVLADLFDLSIRDERQVWRRAIELDAITLEGMRPRDIEHVIESYGIPARTVQSNARNLEALLEEGYEAIAMVDADDYWPYEGRGPNDVLRKRPHAVRVLGIDTAAGVVILSDSAWADPAFSRLQVPLEHFNDAWEDFDWLAVITEVTDDDVREHLAEYDMELEVGASPSARARTVVPTVFLPFAARLSRLLARR